MRLQGSFPYAFVTLVQGVAFTKELGQELKTMVREKIGPIAVPDVIQEAPGLPKTRSGKVTRRYAGREKEMRHWFMSQMQADHMKWSLVQTCVDRGDGGQLWSWKREWGMSENQKSLPL